MKCIQPYLENILFVDGCDLYGSTASFISRKWTTITSMALGTGRFGGGALSLDSSNSAVTKAIANTATVGVSFAINIVAPNTGGTTEIFRITDAGTTQVGLALNASQQLILFRSTSGTVLGTSAAGLASSTWHHIQIKTLIDPAAGTGEVRLNGSASAIITVTGANTRATANSFANDVRFVTSGSVPDFLIDDVIIWDTAGSAPQNNFMGDVRIETIRPTGAGNSTGWSLTGAASNRQAVADTTPDDDTSYVSTAVSTTKDTYAMGDLTGTIATIFATQSNLLCKKTDAGTADIKSVVRIGSTDYAGTAMGPSTSYSYVTELRTTSPATAVAWTGAEINGSEWGSEFN